MKSPLIALSSLAFLSVARADSLVYLSTDAMIQKSDAIAIVEVASPESGKFIGDRLLPLGSKPTRKTFGDRVAAKIERTLKGDLPKQIFIHYASGHWDELFQEGPGRYLVFLRGKTDFLTGTNGWLSSRLIKDGAIDWTSNPGKMPNPVPLADAIAKIAKVAPTAAPAVELNRGRVR
jgi:hypothetical protein